MDGLNRFTIVCAWCGKTIKKGAPPVSHGICAPCAIAFTGEPRKAA